MNNKPWLTSSKNCLIFSSGNCPGFFTLGCGGIARISKYWGLASSVQPEATVSVVAILQNYQLFTKLRDRDDVGLRTITAALGFTDSVVRKQGMYSHFKLSVAVCNVGDRNRL